LLLPDLALFIARKIAAPLLGKMSGFGQCSTGNKLRQRQIGQKCPTNCVCLTPNRPLCSPSDCEVLQKVFKNKKK